MKRIQISPRDLVLASVFAVGLLVFIFLAINQWTQFTLAIGDLRLEEERSKTLAMDKEYLIRLGEKEDALLEQMISLEEMMPAEAGTSKLINYLNELLVKGNFHALQLDTHEFIKEDGYYAIPIKIVFEGEYEKIILFLKELRFGSRPFKITELYMDRNDSLPSKVHCEILAHGFVDSKEK
ncbi:MAG TPA: type 4a pilus biogenesis protein PilO [Clostridia bacterium]|nr:type 4a pilus biogenesis protein PilO [Clostridia bacterium]